MAKGSDHIWERGDQHYLKLAIPRPMQHLFPSKTGKPKSKIVEPLGDSPSAARDEARYRVALYTGVFRQIKAGLLTTPEQVADAMRGPGEPDLALEPEFEAEHRRNVEQTRERDRFLAKLGVPRELRAKVDRALLRAFQPETPRMIEERARSFEQYGHWAKRFVTGEEPAARSASTAGETISQALDGWIKDLTSRRAIRPTTINGHRARVREFTDKFGDLLMTDVHREMAYDFLSGLGRANRTRNNYATTMSAIFKCARQRGKLHREAVNPFEDMKVESTGATREPFTIEEMRTLFAKLPRDTNPAEYSAATAMPWVALISAYSGACLEEICQLTLADVRDEKANGETVTIFDLHEGDDEHTLKNEEARPRYLPVHSAILKAGLEEYIANLRQRGHARLFPGLVPRASKDNKVGPQVGSRFGTALIKLGLKRPGLCFHSFRHTVNKMLEEEARVPEVDRARLLGHVHPTMTAKYGKGKAAFRSAGPMLNVVAAVVEEIKYEGLRL